MGGGLSLLSRGADAAAPILKNYTIRTLSLDGTSAVWFLCCLFLAEILFIFEQRHCRKQKWIVAANIGLAILAANFPLGGVYIIRSLARAVVAVLFLNIGFLLYRYKGSSYKRSRYEDMMFLGLFLLQVLLVFWNGQVELYNFKMGRLFILYYIESILGAVLFLSIFKKWLDRPLKIASWLGKNSIIILCTHPIIMDLLLLIDKHMISILPGEGVVMSLSLCGWIMLIEIPVIMVMRARFQFIFGKK